MKHAITDIREAFEVALEVIKFGYSRRKMPWQSIPANLARDADIILADAIAELEKFRDEEVAVEALKKYLEELADENFSLSDEANELSDEVAKLKAREKSLEEDIEYLRDRIAELEDENERLVNELKEETGDELETGE